MNPLLIAVLLLCGCTGLAERRIECDNGEVFAVSDKCRLIDYSGRLIDYSGDDVKTDAEKWREKCEEYLKHFEDSPTKQVIYMQIATAYCTRYNSALLEEIKEKTK